MTLRTLFFQRSIIALLLGILSIPFLLHHTPHATVAVASRFGDAHPFHGQRFAHNGQLVVEDDYGGAVLARLIQVEKLERTQTPVVVSGICASACTLYLTLPNTCTAPEALWMFHPLHADPTSSLAAFVTDIFGPRDPFARTLSRTSMARFPKDLAAWQERTYLRMSPDDEHWLLGQDLIQAGWVAPCFGAGYYSAKHAAAMRTSMSKGFVNTVPLPQRERDENSTLPTGLTPYP